MCKASCLSAADLEALAGSVLRLHAYFQAYSWDITWGSGMVSFRVLWESSGHISITNSGRWAASTLH